VQAIRLQVAPEVSDLDFSQDDLSWVVNAYTLFFGGFLLLGGRLADLLGRRRMFMAGMVLFAGASLAGASLAPPLLHAATMKTAIIKNAIILR